MKRAIVFIGLVLLLHPAAVRAADSPRPNLVIINIDDLGYGDIGPFGSTLNRTPHLDRMATEGRRLTTFYAAPVCSPSRAALMTGCYPKRSLPIPHVLFPGNDVGLAPSEVTVAELLKSAGYATGIVGKWHLGDQPEFLPTRQGFDEWFGLPYSNDMGPAADGVKSSFGVPLPAESKNPQPPLPLMRGETVVQRVLATDQTQLVTRYTEEALRFIRAHKDEHFFLYLAHNAVHFPLYPGEPFRGKSANGLYGDWVEEVDWSVGEVLNALRTQGLAEKTLVLFVSDNGGTPRAVNRPLRGFKGSTWEGGVRVPAIAWWPGKIPAGTSSDAMCGMFDVLPTFAALAGAAVPGDRKIDGLDIRPVLMGEPDAAAAHEVFYYYRGLELEAVRDGRWKLVLPSAAANARKAKAKNAGGEKAALLFNLKMDVGESADVAAEHPEVVARLEKLAAAMKDDLGTSGLGPGCRPLGKAANPQPLIGYDGKVRPGFEPKSAAAGGRTTSRPNVILILADDLGYETIGANGGTSYRTPQLDKLAATGVRFTHCFVQPLCTPTRVQLMTGRYNVRNYIRFGTMDPQAVTFANVLHQAGYATCIVGKWQLGRDIDLPKKFGFDESCLWQHTRRPPRYANPGLEINGVEKDYAHGEYGPDLVNDYALDFITRKRDVPFFLYYPMMLTHAPYQPTPDSPDWDPEAVGEQVNTNAKHFADMVAYMDKLVGKLVARLDSLGIRDNTLLLFVGDNGTGRGVRSMMGDRLVIGGKGTTTDAGMHVPLIASWPGRTTDGQVCADLVDSTDLLPTILDAAGVTAPSGLKLDGRTFLPQILGAKGQPRDWVYSWYSPRQSADMTVRELAFNHRYKLYRSGEFFDLSRDPGEKHPLKVAGLDGEAATAAKLLQGALDQFNDARPPALDRASEQADKGKAKSRKSTTKARRKGKK
ncbi:MAG: sulfatase-like hydrolase/transferase [Sedimentisphaerales bacterium]|nr:sulfatase-like hydrolase/transferase [Sedimentisphaerales bacterium]